MSTENRLLQLVALPAVAITGSTILVGCGGYSGGTCGSYGSYGSYGTFGSYGSFGASGPGPRVHGARRQPAAGTMPPAGSPYAVCGPPAVAAGVYEGTVASGSPQQQTPVVAIIADNGDGRMSGQDGTYYRLNVGISANSLSGSYSGYSDTTTFPDGNQSTTGSVSAVATGTGFSGQLTDAKGDNSPLTLTLDNVSSSGSALSSLQGAWAYANGGFSLSLTISSDGTFTASDSNGCTYSGGFGLIDPSLDVYSERHVRTCNGSAVTFTGLATYFPPSASVMQQIELLTDDGAGEFMAAVLK